jgi:diacylglycerol kinase (ATP)
MKKLIKSFGYALDGLLAAIKTERNIKIHLVAAVLVVLLGLYLGLSAVQWCLVAFAIGFVLVSELFNTSIERLSSAVADGKQSQSIKAVKDISAAAVFISAITALVTGIFVLFIPLVDKLCNL